MLAREEELTKPMYFSCEREDSVQSYYFSSVHTCLAKTARCDGRQRCWLHLREDVTAGTCKFCSAFTGTGDRHPA